MSPHLDLAPIDPLLSDTIQIRTADVSFVDPNVESDIYADKPWALSPMVASMNNLSIGTSATGSTITESHKDLEGMFFLPLNDPMLHADIRCTGRE